MSQHNAVHFHGPISIITCLADWRGRSYFSLTLDLQHVSVHVLTHSHAMTKGCQESSLAVFLCPSFLRCFQLSLQLPVSLSHTVAKKRRPSLPDVCDQLSVSLAFFQNILISHFSFSRNCQYSSMKLHF
ncbi:hypothetical protein BsWGS_11266 [Bradybaena similaris]